MQNTKKSLSHFLHFKENYLRAFRSMYLNNDLEFKYTCKLQMNSSVSEYRAIFVPPGKNSPSLFSFSCRLQ